MLTLTLRGKNLKELHQEVLNAADEVRSINKLTGEVSIEAPVEAPVAFPPPVILPTVETIAAVARDTAPVTQQTSQVDRTGLPWDARIHSGKKDLTTKGEWRRRRNLDDSVYNMVVNELRGQTQTGPAPSMYPAAPVVPQAPTPAVTVPSAPVQALPQTDNLVHSLETFTNNLPMIMTTLLNQGKIDENWIKATNANYGVANIWEIAKSPANVSSFFEFLTTHGLVTKAG